MTETPASLKAMYFRRKAVKDERVRDRARAETVQALRRVQTLAMMILYNHEQLLESFGYIVPS